MNNLEREYQQARPYIEYHYPELASALYEDGMMLGVMRGTGKVIQDIIQQWLDLSSQKNSSSCGDIWAFPKIEK